MTGKPRGDPNRRQGTKTQTREALRAQGTNGRGRSGPRPPRKRISVVLQKQNPEQPAGRVASLGRDGLRGVAQQRRQRDDGEHGQHEEQRMRVRPEPGGDEDDRHEAQQPEQWVVADFLEQGVHAYWPGSRSLPATGLLRRQGL